LRYGPYAGGAAFAEGEVICGADCAYRGQESRITVISVEENGPARFESDLDLVGRVPFLVGALEVFDAFVIEVPDSGGYFIDQIVIVSDQ